MRLTKRELDWIQSARCLNGLAENVANGDMKIVGWKDDEPSFRLTRKGNARAKALIAQAKAKGDA